MVLRGDCKSGAREQGLAACEVGILKGGGKTEGKKQSFHSRSGEEGVGKEGRSSCHRVLQTQRSQRWAVHGKGIMEMQ